MTTPLARLAVLSFCLPALLASCASTAKRPEAPEIQITQTSEPSDMPGIDMAGGLPVEYNLHLVNSLDIPVKLVSVEMESFGSAGAYQLNQVHHNFARIIGPHGEADVPIRAWVNVMARSMSGEAVGAVTLRGSARFDSAAGVLHRSFLQRVR